MAQPSASKGKQRITVKVTDAETGAELVSQEYLISFCYCCCTTSTTVVRPKEERRR
jgi:hypothetical protein